MNFALSKVNYENSYVAGICLLPSYVCGALIFARGGVLMWVLGMILLILLTNMLYQWCVLLPIKTNLKQWQRYWFTLVGQIALWCAAIFLISII